MFSYGKAIFWCIPACLLEFVIFVAAWHTVDTGFLYLKEHSYRFDVVQYFALHDHQLAFLKITNGSIHMHRLALGINLLLNFTSLMKFGLHQAYFHSISGISLPVCH